MKSYRLLVLALMLLADLAGAVTCTDNTIPSSNPDSVYTDHGDGTVTDQRTGLMWKKCAEGQTSSGETCTGSDSQYAWSDALARAETASFAGRNDWRLPNLKELSSLVEACRVGPAINNMIFPNASGLDFWSGSPSTSNSNVVWYVHFYYGSASGSLRSGTYSVRLGRGGQAFNSLVATCTLPGTVSGRVIDKTTGQALSDVTVTLGATPTTSAADGSFSFTGVAAGERYLTVNLAGYASGGTRVDVCGNTAADVRLTRNASVNGPNAASGYAADPVNTATGNYTFARNDLKLPGKGIGFAFERGYNSLDPVNGPLGFGWTHNYHASLAVDGSGNATIRHGDGHTVTFAANGGAYIPQYGVFDTLVKEADASYTLTKKDLSVHRFGTDGKLLSIADRNANTITLAYTGTLLTRVTDSAGRHVDFTYDAGGRITRLTDPLSRTVQFSYDAAGNLATSTDPAGHVTAYGYDANHQMLTATDPRGHVFVSNTYDAALRVVSSQRDAKGGVTSYAYDPVTRRTTITDPLGKISVHTHDSLLRLIREDNALGHSQHYSYDSAGNRSSVTDRLGRVTGYEYDAAGNVTYKADAQGGSTLLTYDARNNPLTRTDALGKLTSFAYDVRGNLTATTNALGHTSSTTYDSAGLPLTLTDPRGNVTTNTWDAQGNLIQVSDALGNTTSFTYDAVGRRLTRTDTLGRIMAYAYDANDNLVSITDAAGKATLHAYDGNNNRVSTTDRLGRVSTAAYDRKDLPTTLTDALGGVTATSYDALDRKVATTDQRGKLTRFDYDAAGRLIRVTNGLGQQTQYAYDAQGNRTGVTDALGHAGSFGYDALNRLVRASDALANTTTTAYDAVGRVTSTTNAKGQATRVAYDDAGRLVQVTDAAGGVVAHAYDAAGNRTTMTDARGNVTSYAWDALNRLITRTEPGGYVTAYGYDAVGNRIRVTRPDGGIVQYAYDALDRLASVTYPDASQVAFSYDFMGKRTAMVDALGTTSYAYDALDRLTGLVDPFGKSVAYAYDAAGNLTTLTYPDGKQVAYAYDALNRLTSLSDWAGRSTAYSYDAAGRLTGSTLPNGAQASYGYDAADRLTSLAHQANAQTFASYAYSLDALGNQTQVAGTEPIAPVLPAAATSSYSYDADNRLTQVDAAAQTFDANGNLATRAADSFTWDAGDRLKQSTVAGNASSYHYDGTGNRLVRTASGSTTRFVLDVSGALSRVLAETDAAGAITAWYVYGLGLVERVGADASLRFYHHDSRGSTVALSDGTGAITDRYAYDPFGQIDNASGTTPNPFKYVGRFGLFDEGNGLIYIRARYYNPAQGRFLSKDPKPGSDTDTQSLHRYVYAMNNPVRFVDVSGLSRQEVSGGQASLSQSSDPDRRHRRLLEMQASQNQALQYELDAIYWNAKADVLQGAYDALQTTEALFTGDVVGVGTGLSRQFSTYLKITGHGDAGWAIDRAADIVDLGDAIYGFTGMVGNLQTLVPAINDTGLNLRNIQKLDAGDSVAKMYKSILSPIVKTGFGDKGWGGIIGGALFGN